jgi:hypothetical protein
MNIIRVKLTDFMFVGGLRMFFNCFLFEVLICPAEGRAIAFFFEDGA